MTRVAQLLSVLLALTLIPAPVASVVQERPGGNIRVTLKASAEVTTGDPATLKGRVRGSDARRVTIERKNRASWRAVGKARVANSGRFRFRTDALSSATVFRACVRAQCSRRQRVRTADPILRVGKLAYLESESNRVVVRDLATGSEWVAYDGDESTQNVVLSPDGSWVGWTYYGSGSIPSDRIVIRRVGSAEGEVNVLASHQGRFDFIDSFDFSPASDRIAFVADTPSDTQDYLYTVSVDGSGLQRHVARSGSADGGERTIWSPLGDTIATAAMDAEFELYDLNTSQASAAPQEFFGWSPDQTWRGLAPDPYNGRAPLKVANVITGETTRLLDPAGSPSGPEDLVWSGDLIVWAYDPARNDSSEVVRAVVFPGGGSQPAPGSTFFLGHFDMDDYDFAG